MLPLNIYQELFETLKYAVDAYGYWGLPTATIIFILLLIKAVLPDPIKPKDFVNEPIKTISEFSKFHNWFLQLKHLTTTNHNISLRQFCSIKYKNKRKCVVFYTNSILHDGDYNIFNESLFIHKLSPIIILCKQIEQNKDRLLKSINDTKKRFPRKENISMNSILFFDELTFHPKQLIRFIGEPEEWVFRKILFTQ